MSEAVVYQIPPISVPEPKADKFRQEQWAFYCMLGDLLKTHKCQYVAVHDRQVIEAGTDKMEVVRKAYDRVGVVPLFVGYVSDEPPPLVRMPRFRVQPSVRFS